MQQHNTWGKDRNDLASLAGQVITEGASTGVTPLEDLARDAMAYDQQEDPSREVEEIEDGEAPGGFDYFMSQLNDMKKDLDMGDSADSNIYQEIRHVAEQIMTWCDDQQA
tara:strand:- start:566 stop:895 length:330 start_codon:yes stop_codon:yes gene_type:complete